MINNKKTKKNKKQFLYNPNDPKKSFDVYIDKDPSDTIPIKYTTVDDVKKTIKNLESLYPGAPIRIGRSGSTSRMACAAALYSDITFNAPLAFSKPIPLGSLSISNTRSFGYFSQTLASSLHLSAICCSPNCGFVAHTEEPHMQTTMASLFERASLICCSVDS